MKTAEEILKSKLDGKITFVNNPDYTFNKVIEAMEEYRLQSHPSPMSAEQVVKETGHDLINGALPYIEEHLPKKYIDTLAKYLDSYLDKVFSTTPSVKADGWVSVDKEKEFHKVLKCLKNNKVMVGTREDGIYIRLAGRESEGEAFTLHFALAYPFPKLPPHQNNNYKQ